MNEFIIWDSKYKLFLDENFSNVKKNSKINRWKEELEEEDERTKSGL